MSCDGRTSVYFACHAGSLAVLASCVVSDESSRRTASAFMPGFIRAAILIQIDVGLLIGVAFGISAARSRRGTYASL